MAKRAKAKEPPKPKPVPKADGLVERDGLVFNDGMPCYVYQGDDMVPLKSLKQAAGKSVFFRKSHHHTFQYIDL